MKKYLAYLFIIITFYAVPPLLIKDTGSAIVCLLIIFPWIILAISFWYAKINGFRWYFSLIAAICWLPSIFIYYDESAAIYAGIYGALSLAGQGAGHLFGTRKRQKDEYNMD